MTHTHTHTHRPAHSVCLKSGPGLRELLTPPTHKYLIIWCLWLFSNIKWQFYNYCVNLRPTWRALLSEHTKSACRRGRDVLIMWNCQHGLNHLLLQAPPRLPRPPTAPPSVERFFTLHNFQLCEVVCAFAVTNFLFVSLKATSLKGLQPIREAVGGKGSDINTTVFSVQFESTGEVRWGEVRSFFFFCLLFTNLHPHLRSVQSEQWIWICIKEAVVTGENPHCTGRLLVLARSQNRRPSSFLPSQTTQPQPDLAESMITFLENLIQTFYEIFVKDRRQTLQSGGSRTQLFKPGFELKTQELLNWRRRRRTRRTKLIHGLNFLGLVRFLTIIVLVVLVLTAELLLQAAPCRQQVCGSCGYQTQDYLLSPSEAGVLTATRWKHTMKKRRIIIHRTSYKGGCIVRVR